MKRYLIVLLLIFSLPVISQTSPAYIRRVATFTTIFDNNIPQGSFIYDGSTGKTYKILHGITSTNSLSTLVNFVDYVESMAVPANAQWIGSYDYAGNAANLWSYSKDNTIIPGANVEIGQLWFPANAGLQIILNMPVNHWATNLDTMGYSIKIGNQKFGKIYGLWNTATDSLNNKKFYWFGTIGVLDSVTGSDRAYNPTTFKGSFRFVTSNAFRNRIQTLNHDSLTGYIARKHFYKQSIDSLSTGLSTGLVKVTNGLLSTITDGHSNWDKYNQWDGGSTGLTATTGRTSLELGTAALNATGDFATAAQGTLATNAMPKSGGTFTGNVLFTDNTYDIGANGDNRPRTGYFGTSLITPTVNLITGSHAGYTWQCTNTTTGAGAWANVTGAVYLGTVNGADGKYNGGGTALIDGTGTAGNYYACNNAGTYDYGSGNITLAIGDQLYYSGTVWLKIPGAGSYTLPIATAVLGGVITNSNISVNSGTGGMTVLINANLTGPITSTGNTTSVAAQTGTGSKFVMDTSPTLITPFLGTPTSGNFSTGSFTWPTFNQSTSGTAAKATILETTRAIYGNNFNGSAALTQIIASNYGGTGNGFTKFTGPTTAEKTFTLPNASATILTDNAVITSQQGGTGINNTGRTLTINSNSGTIVFPEAATTITFPASTATLARTDAGNTFTGHQTIESVTSTGATGTGKFVFSISPSFTGLVTEPSTREGQKIESIDGSVIVCDGDSRTVGYTGGTVYPYSDHLGLDATYTIYNTGIGGAGLVYYAGQSWLPDVAYANIDKYYSNVGVRNIIVIWAGYNDMSVHDINENVTFRALVAYCLNRKQKGWKVIVCTEINSNGPESRRLAFNILVRSQYAGFADGLCDLGNTSPFNTSTSYLNETYYYDGCHLTAAGYSVIATTVSTAITDLANKTNALYKSVVLQVYDPSATVVTGSNIAQFSIPSGLDGWKISKVAAHCYTNTGQLVEVQLKNSESSEPTTWYNVLSTVCTVYHAYYDSKNYGDPNSVINTTYAQVYEGYVLSVDVNYPTATTRKGLDVRIDFTK